MSDKTSHVELHTRCGVIQIELDAEKAPITVKNFLEYVESGHYDSTIFHRAIPGFMIQGGGFTEDMDQKSTQGTIKNEASNGLLNTRGTVAMARTENPDSASAQFFINLSDNDFLNPGETAGYTVFGRVTGGLEVIDKIASVKTGTKGHHQDVPIEAVKIEAAVRTD
ncbi:peptidylprolyl isomerase [Streptomyces sp. NPDC002886]|uniref:peptidylprolyl isomerase n=1 Tax=Streptomyces sp. NPDC002886 TaxID=3364667 RepID=UPI003681A244